MHLLSSEYEVIVSRTRIMLTEQTDLKTRLVGLACPIANGRDVATWMGVNMDQKNGAYFNFLPSVRSQQLETSVQPFDQSSRHARLLSMAKPAFNHIKDYFKNEIAGSCKAKAVVFVSDRKQARLTALDFVTFCNRDEEPHQFRN